MAFTPICVSCQREMRCRKNGYFFMDYGRAAVWSGDLYQCEGCQARVITGVGRDPVIESFEPEFARITSRAEVELTRDLPKGYDGHPGAGEDAPLHRVHTVVFDANGVHFPTEGDES